MSKKRRASGEGGECPMMNHMSADNVRSLYDISRNPINALNVTYRCKNCHKVYDCKDGTRGTTSQLRRHPHKEIR